jgi:DNA anti-recombination protein RmuC
MSWGSNNLGSSSPSSYPPPSTSGGGLSGQDWASMIATGGKSTADVLNALSIGVGSKKEAKEAARRTLSRLTNSARGRAVKSFRANQNYRDEMTESQAEQMREMARSFIESLSGSTGRT